MKRSEMVNEMARTWLGLFPNEAYGDTELLNEVIYKMSKLLAAIEYRGMKPPVKKRCPVLLTDEFTWEQ